MARNMLIDAAHPEETRVVVVDGTRVEEFDYETQARLQLRGNIYLAKVIRVEPSLQAAFVEYGGNRHGFLAFGEIHPDYYQIPSADREVLLAEEAAIASEDEDDEESRARRAAQRKYKIQEVIRRRQIILVQVVKEERGNKGAALTTYLSLAGRYCVLMPNTPRGGGISRKITTATDRKRLKSVVSELEVPQGMGLIIRTAGAKRTKTEIKRDYDYLLRLWDNIRDTTLKSMAPAVVHEEDNLVKRAIRDLYDKDIDSIHVEGEAAYREAKDFVKMLMPSHAKKVQLHKDRLPLFTKFGAEDALSQITSPIVQLKSGGYIVINQTEALVAIDVNSGRSTKERSIETTALKTNLEAAEEACRQMRMRDLAGLIVIDFIDMEENRNDRAVEKRMKECLKDDRARLQMGRISNFGLLELSRQRRRTGIMEGTSHVCPTCNGTGRVRAPDATALAALRALEMEAARGKAGAIAARVSMDAALYLLNEKRGHLADLEQRFDLAIRITADPELPPGQFVIEAVHARRAELVDDRDEAPPPPRRPDRYERLTPRVEEEEDDDIAEEEEIESAAAANGAGGSEDGAGRRRRRRRRRRGGDRGDGPQSAPQHASSDSDGDEDAGGDEAEDGEAGEASDPSDAAGGDESARRRRRGRRGGRRRRGEGGQSDPLAVVAPSETPADFDAPAADHAPIETPVVPEPEPVTAEVPPEAVAEEAAPEPAAKPKRRTRKPAAPKADAALAEPAPDPAPAPEAAAEPASEPAPAPEEPAPRPEPAADSLAEAAAAATPEEPAKPARKGWWQRKNLFGS
jgi:ribonuclease E